MAVSHLVDVVGAVEPVDRARRTQQVGEHDLRDAQHHPAWTTLLTSPLLLAPIGATLLIDTLTTDKMSNFCSFQLVTRWTRTTHSAQHTVCSGVLSS